MSKICLYLTSFRAWCASVVPHTPCRFTVKEDPDFGLFLESVNGVAGNVHEQTYWEILSENSGEYRRIDLGEFHPQSYKAAHLRKN